MSAVSESNRIDSFSLHIQRCGKPDDRAWLEAAARKHGLIAPKFPVSMHPEEGSSRRYPSYEDRRNYKMPLHSEVWGFDWDPFQSGK